MQDLSLRNAAKEGISLGKQDMPFPVTDRTFLTDMIQMNNGAE